MLILQIELLKWVLNNELIFFELVATKIAAVCVHILYQKV